MENQINIIEIINYLDNNKNLKINESSEEKAEYKILERYNSNNFKKFNDFFKGNIDRIGTLNDCNSIYFSVLYIIFNNFKNIDNLKQNILINQLKKRIIKDDSNDKNLIINSLSNFFNINIILFSYSRDDILIFYKEDELIPYKNNIFINEFNSNYYPLVYKNNGDNIFKYNSSILKEILDCNKLSVYSVQSDKKLIINYNNYLDVLNKSFNIKLLNEIENILQDSESDEYNNSIGISDEKNLNNSSEKISLLNLSDEIKNVNEKNLNNSSEKISLLNLSDEIKNVNEKIIKNDDSIYKDEIIYKIKTTTSKKLEKETKETLQKYIKLLLKNNNDLNLNSKKSILVNYLKENII